MAVVGSDKVTAIWLDTCIVTSDWWSVESTVSCGRAVSAG